MLTYEENEVPQNCTNPTIYISLIPDGVRTGFKSGDKLKTMLERMGIHNLDRLLNDTIDYNFPYLQFDTLEKVWYIHYAPRGTMASSPFAGNQPFGTATPTFGGSNTGAAFANFASTQPPAFGSNTSGSSFANFASKPSDDAGPAPVHLDKDKVSFGSNNRFTVKNIFKDNKNQLVLKKIVSQK